MSQSTHFMADDWRYWFRSRLHPDGFAHPDSPAGGAGTGFARPPGPQRYSWSSSRMPHPDSPAGRSFDWQSELWRIEHQEHEGLSRQIEELERFVAKQSSIFRENLPDPSLKDIYDRQSDHTKTSGFGRSIDHVARGTTHHLNSLLQTLENQIQWFDANSRDLPQRHEFRNLLGTKHIAWEYGTVEEKRELLNHLRGFAERFYEAAAKSIQKQLAEARRTGRQEEFVEKWKIQMRQLPAYASSAGTSQPNATLELATRVHERSPRIPVVSSREPAMVANLLVDVIDGETKTKQAGVIVQIQGPASFSKPSSPKGNAEFMGIPPGSYSITHSDACLKPASTLATAIAGQTVKATLSVFHTHCVLQIEELTFTGNNPVENDTTGNFTPPEWKGGRAEKDQRPVAYARNQKVGIINARFKVVTQPCRREQVTIEGNATFGNALKWTGSVDVSPGPSVVTVPELSSGDLTLKDEIGLFETQNIQWRAKPEGADWSAAGSTLNVVYVTLGNPAGGPNYWTLLDISCRAAAGISNEPDFVKAAFEPFRAAVGKGNGIKRKRDNTELTYYNLAFDTRTTGVYHAADILSGDGTGRCGGWAQLLVHTHRLHGVTKSGTIGVEPAYQQILSMISDRTLLLVQKCAFVGTGTPSNSPFPYQGGLDCLKGEGVKGQGKNNPQFVFANHALVRHDKNKIESDIYDPSYGTGPFPDLKTWEDAGVAGLGQGSSIYFIQDGCRQMIPSQCSKGFIVYETVRGDTLSSVASKFGVASGLTLYNHPYNQHLHSEFGIFSDLIDSLLGTYKTHTLPPSIPAGYNIFIPREISNVPILREY